MLFLLNRSRSCFCCVVCTLFIAGMHLWCYVLRIVCICCRVLSMVVRFGIFGTDVSLIVQQEICYGTAVYAGQNETDPSPAVRSFETAGEFCLCSNVNAIARLPDCM